MTYCVEDEKLGDILKSSEKDRAEHIMLVDLARNDVNRVCQPKTVKVDRLMDVEKFSHVIHLTSQVSGLLREGMSRHVTFLNMQIGRHSLSSKLGSMLSGRSSQPERYLELQKSKR